MGGGWRGIGGAGADVEFGGFSHADAEGGDFFVGGSVEVLDLQFRFGRTIQWEGEHTMPSALRRRLVGFLSAASMALSRARLRPVKRREISHATTQAQTMQDTYVLQESKPPRSPPPSPSSREPSPSSPPRQLQPSASSFSFLQSPVRH